MSNSENVHPGAFIREKLDDCGWSDNEIAEKMGYSLRTLRRCINGRIRLSDNMATQLECIGFGSADSWQLKQAKYDLSCCVDRTTQLEEEKREVENLVRAATEHMERTPELQETIEILTKELQKRKGGKIVTQTVATSAALQAIGWVIANMVA